MRRLLGSHDDVYLPPFELEFHRRRHRGEDVRYTVAELSSKIPDLELDQLDLTSHKTLFRTLIAQMARRHAVAVAGDKTPGIELHPYWYAAALGPVRVGLVHMIRNPIDVVASHLHAEWNDEQRTLALVGEIAATWKRSAEQADAEIPEQYQRVVVRYEDVIAAPVDTARMLATSLELPSDDEQLDRMVALAGYPTIMNSSFGDTGTPISGGVRQMSSRRDYLSDEEAAEVVRQVGPASARWGYETR